MVAAGEWRDYGMDSLRRAAVFSVFRRTRRGAASTASRSARRWPAAGRLGDPRPGRPHPARGHDLEQVLRFFDKGRFSVVE
jgi:hypothetical protein